jgi:hypothetical protein
METYRHRFADQPNREAFFRFHRQVGDKRKAKSTRALDWSEIPIGRTNPSQKSGIFPIREGKIGWGGRIRTFTILINSEVSYRLDHAPAEL